MKTLTFKVLDTGKLPEGIKHTLSLLFPAYAGKVLRLSISEAKEQRSLDQNSYYRGVVLPHVRKVMLDDGDARSLDDWHEVLLLSFSPLVNVKALNGDNIMLPQRTHRMTKEEMAKFITAVSAEMAIRGWPVPIIGDYD